MAVGIFFILLAVLLITAMPVGDVFGIMPILPSIINPSFPYGATDVARSMFTGMNSFTLLAVPLFMISGMIMAEGRLSERLFNFFAYFIDNKTAGSPCAVIVTCIFYTATSGSSPATVSAMGVVTIPFLVSMGYEKIFTASIVTVARGLGVIIPLSISYIVYSAATNASPSKLFTAGITPGVLVGFDLIVYSYHYCRKHREDKERLLTSYNEIRQREFWRLLKDSFWTFLTPVIILGTIYSGIYSPTESTVISVFYGLFVCIYIYKSTSLRNLGDVFMPGAKTHVNILSVIAAATSFARCLTILRYPQPINQSVLAVSDSKIMILLVMNLIMLVCGMIIDNIPNIMVLTPILVPITAAVGAGPIRFDITMMCNLAVGMVTPPMGISLFVASDMTEIPMLKSVEVAVPFLIAFVIPLLIIVFVPQISMFLPSLAG